MTILISIPTMSSGGAERVTSILCNELIQQGYRVILVTDCIDNDIFYNLDKQVEVIPLRYSLNSSCWSRKIYLIKYVLRLRHLLKIYKPEVFISVLYVSFIRSFIAKLGLSLKYIISDHTSFDRETSIFVRFIRYRLYALADAVTVLSKKDFDLVSNHLHKATIIYNPSSFVTINKMPIKRRTILCAGRLDVWRIKGMDIILNIWSQLCSYYPDWTLQIAGSGSESSKEYLRKLVVDLKIENRVCFLGQVTDMESLLKSTAIFALPSRTEGFPMVLLEAMSQGCSCISFSLNNVVSEIFSDMKSGIVVKDGDIAEFSNKLSQLIENENLRNKLAISAISESKKFSINNFSKEWIKLIDKII